MAKIARQQTAREDEIHPRATELPQVRKPTRIVKRHEDRVAWCPSGMFISCSACEFFEKL